MRVRITGSPLTEPLIVEAEPDPDVEGDYLFDEETVTVILDAWQVEEDGLTRKGWEYFDADHLYVIALSSGPTDIALIPWYQAETWWSSGGWPFTSFTVEPAEWKRYLITATVLCASLEEAQSVASDRFGDESELGFLYEFDTLVHVVEILPSTVL